MENRGGGEESESKAEYQIAASFLELFDLNELVPEYSFRQFAAVAGMAIALDYFQYWGSGGIGLACLILILFLLVLLTRPLTFSRGRFFLGGLLLVVVARTVWQSSQWSYLTGLSVLFAFACLEGLATFQVPELIVSAVSSSLRTPLSFLGLLRGAMSTGLRASVPGKPAMPSLLPVIVPALVCMVFLLIFRAANPVLQEWISLEWSWFQDSFEWLLGRMPSEVEVAFLIYATATGCVLVVPTLADASRLNAWLGGTEELRQGSDAPSSERVTLAAINTLAAVNVVFLFYNALDVLYLWVQQSAPVGITLSEYARSGAAWLTLALALASALLGVVFKGELNFHRRAPVLKTLAWVWLAQNFFLALGTLRRMQMYVDFNGLTRARIVGVAGICLVVFGLGVVAQKIRKQKSFLWMVRRQLAAFAMILVFLYLLPMDGVITACNTRIILRGEHMPAVQLLVQTQSAEGLPGLLPLLDSDSSVIAKGAAAVLLREEKRMVEYQQSHPRWTCMELSRKRALEVIERERKRIQSVLGDTSTADALRELGGYTRRWY